MAGWQEVDRTDVTLSLRPSDTVGTSPNDQYAVLCTVNVPPGTGRVPTDLVCVVDVSGSMGVAAVPVGPESGAVSLTALDIVKHALRTIIQMLGPNDRLGLVKYNQQAETVMELMKMDDTGKEAATSVLDNLKPLGNTNIWDGLLRGLECQKAASDDGVGRMKAVFLLTDGQPTVSPPRGELAMLNRYVQKNESLGCTVNTFGFGYDLDTDILQGLAQTGKGTYSFIPDNGFVGTVFIHAVANLLCTFGHEAKLKVEVEPGVEMGDPLGDYTFTKHEGWVEIELGTLMYGQSQDVVLPMLIPRNFRGEYAFASLDYSTAGRTVAKVPNAVVVMEGTPEALRHMLRCQVVETCREVYALGNRAHKLSAPQHLAEAQQKLEQMARDIQASPAARDAVTRQAVAAMLQDVQGQMLEAVSRQEWFNKWGKHFIPSIMLAHKMQVCNNFKDPGVQVYGGQLSKSLQDAGDDIFLGLPAPVADPQNRVIQPQSTATYASPTMMAPTPEATAAATLPFPPPRAPAPQFQAPVNMRMFHDCAGPCFSGDSVASVVEAGGRLGTKRVQDLRAGDVVQGREGGARILCVIKTVMESGEAQLVTLADGLKITPWHPVRLGHEWLFPASIAKPVAEDCPAVFNFVLAAHHTMKIGGLECCTLGHGFKGPVIEHPFFGTDAVLRDLLGMDGWQEGEVVLRSGCVVRDSSGRVCGLRQSTSQAEAAVTDAVAVM
mmetsp:Transcript_26516/g.60439  ORF Transcript_26516/g.60439 Transcript_26516/m.60439 type:complete len:720 (+) Transcript_26516:57-2216(+)|eukprot:CAMPEP_0204333234 /NCGR_PEP_ID=MMETSP0469-20131031/17059_1 /ASSEMBLY_ACC=CAM_ASM_000384 /TAXON_ID=2969 /ORGANISM="Oxyrrhis marina" /LENGTH=719 /DNA_ID=CAMNT_0051316537 /DNA_START=23 /DNA_END=2182 /DNA_ORIENTATION=+